jgi:dTDP-glucose pyrophosphorylase
MINIVIPLGGKSTFFDSNEYQFPKSLIEINGKPMIQVIIEKFMTISDKKQFIFVINREDCDKFHIDSVVSLLTNNEAKIVYLSGDTKGAACSVLMGISYINNDDELIIANGDQIIGNDLNNILKDFRLRNLDGGLICFDSVHPKWSYAKLENDRVVETAEKKPISRNAIAGFYYFKHGKDFVSAAFKSIEKDANVNGLYFIAPTYNELVLENKNLGVTFIDISDYHSFYSPAKISEYELYIAKKSFK